MKLADQHPLLVASGDKMDKMNKKQLQEPELNVHNVRAIFDFFIKDDRISSEFKKEFIKALKFIIKHLTANGKSLTFTQMNELLKKKGLKQVFGGQWQSV